MKICRFFVSVFLFLASAVSMQAQWGGSVDASGGIGMTKSLRGLGMTSEGKYLKHGYAGLGANLQYKDSLFQWTSKLSAGCEPNKMDYVTADILYGADGEIVHADGLIKLSQIVQTNADFLTNAVWSSRPGRSVSAWFQYSFLSSDGYNANSRFDQTAATSAYGEDPDAFQHVFGTGVRFSRQMDNPRHALAGNLTYNHTILDQSTVWLTINLDGAETDWWADLFKVTPHEVTDNLSGELHFKDSVLTGTTKLVLDPGIRLSGNRSIHENSGATAVGSLESIDDVTDWRDSTAIRERFDFGSLDIQPYLVVDLAGRKVRMHADYAPMFYARRLTDSTHRQGLKFQRPYVVGNGNVSWMMGQGHELRFNNRMAVVHPSYLQVCWFDRTAGYLDRLYRGNPDLKSNVSRSYGLTYSFNYKRFNTSTAVSFSRSRNEIIQTWFEEEIDHRSYRVFTWINGAESRVFGVSQTIGWKGKVLTANAGFGYNHAHQSMKETDQYVEANDWSLYGNVAANLGKGWSLSADMRYQSQVTRFLEMFDDYCIVNAKVKKQFKKLTLYLEGRHLADTPQITKVYSEDMTHYWTERIYLNRRLVILGLNWRF